MPFDAQLLAQRSLQESAALMESSLSMVPQISQVAQAMHDALQQGHTIYALGNGGSAAEAQHFVAELVGRFERDNCLSAHALSTDTSILTALANDFNFDYAFERQVRAQVRSGDVVLCISTSGNSPSVVNAARAARELGAIAVGLSSQDGGALSGICQLMLNVPARRVCRVQEVHLAVLHILCELIEQHLEAQS